MSNKAEARSDIDPTLHHSSCIPNSIVQTARPPLAGCVHSNTSFLNLSGLVNGSSVLTVSSKGTLLVGPINRLESRSFLPARR